MFGAIVGAITGIASAGVQARAMKAQGKAAEREAKYNAQVMENKALAIEYASQAESARMRRSQRRMAESQRAAFQKSGAVITEDTPLQVMLEQIEEMSLDVNNFRRNKMIEAQHARAGKEMTLYQGRNAVYLSKQKARATMLSGILSGVGKIASGFTPTDPAAQFNPLLAEAPFAEIVTTPSPTSVFSNAPMGYFDSFSGNYSSIG